MKRRLVDLLRCVACGERLQLQVLAERREVVKWPSEKTRCSTYCALHDSPAAACIERAQTDCIECYGRDVREGVLSCTSCGGSYPIIAGVPRLIRDAFEEYRDFFQRHEQSLQNTKSSIASSDDGPALKAIFHRRTNEGFTLQWQNYEYSDKTWFKDDDRLRHREFLVSMDLQEDQLRGALVLDAGCGNGKLTMTVAQYGAEIVGMDLTRSVERANERRASLGPDTAPFIHFIQGNVLEPPFAREAFDYVHTSGVIHHTPNPEGAFRALLRLARRSGRLYVQVYRKREMWVAVPNRIVRALTCRLPARALYRLCELLVPTHTALVMAVAYCRGEQSPIREANRRERAVSLFDHLSPRYQFRYVPGEVKRMFERAGLTNIKDVTLANEQRHLVAFVGEKS